MAGFGSSIKLNGESEYRRALNQINQSLKEVGSEMKVVSASFDKNDKSSQAMAQKTDILNKKLEEQKNKLSILTQKYNEMNDTYGKNSTAQKELTAQLTKEKAKLDEIGSTLGKTSKEYQNQQKIIDSLEDKQVQYNNAVSKAKTEMNLAQAEINKTTKELKELGEEEKKVNKNTKESSEGFTVFKGVLANLGAKAITSAIGGLKKLGGAILSVKKQAIESYASYEQLVGGVDTLFKSSSKTVQQYANVAYKTAGISANQYMEQVTSFSASLLQSLGGDTKKASEYANRAIIDMSDNANKMGTSMESLTMAYQSFSRGQYQLLDNLKLGYGGTKTEMQRLISDASKLKDVQKELGVTVDSSSLSFGNIVNAISVMQKKMDIAGTTSKEASSTIEGSVNSMKASWQNLLTGLADGNQEIGPLIDNFINSVATAWENLKPRIKQTVDGIKQAISEIWSKRGDIKKEIPELEPIINAMEWIINNKELVIGSITAIIGAMAVGKVATFVNTMVTLGTTLAGIPAVAGLCSSAMTMLGTAFTFMTGPIGIAIATVGALVGAFVVLWNKSEGFRNFWKGLWDGLKDVVSKAVDKIVSVFNKVVDFIKNNWQGLLLLIVNPFAGAFKLLYDNCEGFRNFWSNLWEGVKTTFSNIVDAITNAFNSFVDYLASIPERISEFIQNAVTFFQELPYKIGYAIGLTLGYIIKFGEDAINWVTTVVPNIIDGIVNFFKELPSKIWEWLVNTYNKVSEWGNNVKDKAIEVGTDFINNIIDFFSQLPSKIWNWLVNAYTNITNFGSQVINKAIEIGRTFIQNMINYISQLPSKIWNFLTQTIDKVKTFTTNMVTKAKEGAKNTFNAIVDTLKNLPNRMLDIGKNIVEGLWNGIKGMGSWIKDKIKDFSKGIVDGMKKALGIHSPSRVFKEAVGKNIALGIGEGFTDEMKNVTSDMQDAIPTNFDLNGSYGALNSSNGTNVLSNYNSLVEAFTNALQGMKIELDDEEVGSFVKKTVEDAIYS